MKKKKFWITLISALAVVLVVFVGGHFLTKLSSVSVVIRTRLTQSETRLEEGILDKVKETAEFDYKKSVLFINTDKNVEKIEKANPYIKVQQVIRKFPNKIYLYVSERIPKYRIKDSELSDKWYILDDEFKVLDSVGSEELEAEKLLNKTIEISYLKEKSFIGEFLNNEKDLSLLNSIMSGVYGKTKDYFAVTAIDYNLQQDTFYLTMKAGNMEFVGGCVLQLVGSNDIKNKAFKATSVYVGEGDFEKVDLSEKVIIISDENGCKIKDQEG